MKSLICYKWLMTVLVLSLCSYSPAKEKKETQPQKRAEIQIKPPNSAEREQQTMNYISLSILEGDTPHWVSETTPDTPPAEVLIVESPSTSIKEHGTLLVIASPGIYPYQARWYPSFRKHMTSKGWHLLSIGLSPIPKLRHTTRSQLADMKGIEQKIIIQKQQDAYQEQMMQWQSQAISRGQLLTTFSNNNTTGKQAILIGVGFSAHIAGLIAENLGTQLTGLVLIDLESPTRDTIEEFTDKLSKQGPILDIVTQSKTHIVQAAKHRKKLAARAGNADYRLVLAPTGLKLDRASQAWLTAIIHGWSMATQK